jgi:hypothetical protein
MKKIFIFLILVGLAAGVKAQRDYSFAIGVRAAPSPGLTVKTFISGASALEFIGTTRWGGLNLTALYELHTMAFQTEGLNFYYGIGAHLGFWGNDNEPPWRDENDSGTVFGLDGILGLEYTFDEIPFNIGVDWKPALNLVPSADFWVDEFAISVRFVIR